MAHRERLDGDEPKRKRFRADPEPQPEIAREPEDNDEEGDEEEVTGDGGEEDSSEEVASDGGEKPDTIAADRYWGTELEDDEWVLYEGKLLPPGIAEHVKKVNEIHDRAVEKIIATGQALIEMKDALKDRVWIKTFQANVMRFGLRTADKYMAIARNTAISQNSAKMPGSPDALEFISQISPEVVEQMADKGIIKPSMTIEQARKLAAVALPKILDDLFEVVMREDAAETAELIAQHLWWLYVHKRGGGGGAARSLIATSADWLATFSETYKRCEEQHRSDWLEQSDNAHAQEEINKKEKKMKFRSRKSSRFEYRKYP